MPAAIIDIIIDQGSIWNPTFVWKDENDVIVDITGWSAKMDIREKKNKNSSLIHRCQSSSGSIVIVGEAGQIKPTITATETDAFDFKWAWYDIELTPPSGAANTVRVAQGAVRLDTSTTN